MTEYRYRITSAAAQTGNKPPYRLLTIPVRMKGDMPQIKVESGWIDYPKNGPRPELPKTYYGRPLAGVATDWELI